jgi:ABC-type glycerol-3-phosphate transport system substrate-binding protein
MQSSKINRREFLRLSAGVAASGFLAACGSTPTPAPTVAEPTQPPAPAATAAPTEPAGLTFKGHIEFWDWNYDPREVFLEQLIEEWQGLNPGITLSRSSLPWGDAQTKLLTAVSAGNPPPFSNVHVVWRYQLQKSKSLEPYPEDLLPFDKLVSTPFNTDPETGRVYTSTFNYFCDQLYLNLAHLEEEGISLEEIPTTWDDHFKLTEQLTRRDASGRLERSGWTLNHYYSRQWLWQSLVYQQGGWLYNEDGTEALWNSDEGVQALQMIKDVYHKYEVDDVESLGLFDAFGTQMASTYISQGYTGAYINSDHPDMTDNWITAPTPTFGGTGDPAWGMVSPEEGFCVFADAPDEQKEVGFSFIDYMLGTDEHVLDWAIIQGGPPDRLDLLEHPRLAREDLGKIIETQAVTMPWRVNPGEQPLEAEAAWRVMFDRVLLEDADPKAALDEATEAMNAAFKASGEEYSITERFYKPPA